MSFFFVPANKEQSAAVAAVARANGCTPEWNEHYEAWCCTCPSGTHSADQQCSIINRTSSQRKEGR